MIGVAVIGPLAVIDASKGAVVIGFSHSRALRNSGSAPSAAAGPARRPHPGIVAADLSLANRRRQELTRELQQAARAQAGT